MVQLLGKVAQGILSLQFANTLSPRYPIMVGVEYLAEIVGSLHSWRCIRLVAISHSHLFLGSFQLVYLCAATIVSPA